jgi:diacylglycerol kinase family enzyme
MTWAVLANPAAGRFAVDLNRLEAALDGAGVDARIRAVVGREQMREAVLEASSDGLVAVVGGDGTVNLAVDTLLSAGVDPLPVVGILPSGTGCDLLRTFGIPQRLEDAAHHLNGDRTYRIDVGVLDGDWGRRHFVNVAQAGVGAAAAESAPRLPRWIGSVRYPLAFLARLPRFPRCEVEMDAARSYRGSALAVSTSAIRP